MSPDWTVKVVARSPEGMEYALGFHYMVDDATREVTFERLWGALGSGLKQTIDTNGGDHVEETPA